MLMQIKIGEFKKNPNDEDTIDAIELVESKGIRYAHMVPAEQGKGYCVEITYEDGVTISLGAHKSEVGEIDYFDQDMCAEILYDIFTSHRSR